MKAVLSLEYEIDEESPGGMAPLKEAIRVLSASAEACPLVYHVFVNDSADAVLAFYVEERGRSMGALVEQDGGATALDGLAETTLD